MNKTLKLALVGCGWITDNYVAGYADLVKRGCREFTFAACCDISEAMARKRANEIKQIQGTDPVVFKEVQSLIRSGSVDGAVVCLPHFLHHTVATELLEGGIHVMLEKPIGITIRATLKIIETATRKKRVFATAENIRRYLGARACEWAINKKKLIGDILAVDVRHISWAPFDLQNPSMKWRVIKNLVGGGMIMDSGAHFTDMMLHLFGDVDEVFCFMNTHDRRIVEGAPLIGNVPADVEDSWHAVIRFKSGLHATWTYSRSYHGETRSGGTYYGSQGTLSDPGFPFHCFQGGGNVVLANGQSMSKEQMQIEYLMELPEKDKQRLFPYGCSNGFGIEMWDFVDAIQTGRKPEIDGQAGLRAKALCEACYESAACGKPVKYDDVLNGKIAAYQNPINDYWNL